MKNFFVFLSMFLLMGLTSLNAQNWTLMTPPGISGKWVLTGVAFPTSENGFAVGYDYSDVDFTKAVTKGIIIEYKGGSWAKSEYPQPSVNWQLNKVWFLNENEGWAVGMNKETKAGLLMHYKSGKWEIVDLPSPGYEKWILYNVFFLNENEGWVAGGSFGKDGPVLFHFKDGKWSHETSKEFAKQTIMAVHAFSPSNVFAGGFREGDLSGIMQTNKAYGSFIINSATGWEKEKLPMLSGNVVCEDFAAINEKSLYAAGYMPDFQNTPRTGQILHYDGKKWENIKLDDPVKEWTLSAIAFADEATGWAVGYNWTKNKGLFLQCKKGQWSGLDKKTEPVVSEKWILHDVVYDGKGAWYAVGGDISADKGIIMKLPK